MTANWPTDADRGETLAKEYRAIWEKVGADRFAIGVTRIIHESELRFFPSCGEFRGYIPNSNDKTWRRDPGCERCHGTGWQRLPDYEARRMYGDQLAMCSLRCNDCLNRGESNMAALRADRAKNPDEYFGEADVIALMRIAKERKEKGLPPLPEDSMIAEVLAVRHAVRERGGEMRGGA